MFQTKLKLKLWFDKKRLQRLSNRTNKQVSSGGITFPIISFLFKSITLLFFSFLIIFPLFYMISTSLMTYQETLSTETKFVPKTPQWNNFKVAMLEGYWQALLITLIVTATSIILKIFITMLMGYAFSLKNWRFKKIIWTIFLTLLMIPEVALLYGQYQVVVKFNLKVESQVIMALILPFITSLFSAFMFKNAFEAISFRTKKAAFIDGTSHIKYFIKIAIPTVSSTIWTVVILTGFIAWNSYIWPSLLLEGTQYSVINTWLFKTGFDSSSGGSKVMMNIRLAAAIFAILPMFIVYFVFRSRIMKAISQQSFAIKG